MRPVVHTALMVLVLNLLGCAGIPVLESPQCTDARNSVREFYSQYFGNRSDAARENLLGAKRFLSSELFDRLSRSHDPQTDYFTATTNDFPKAFRVGACKELDPSKTEVEVLLFWKDDVRSEQRSVRVETINSGERWLINNVIAN